MYDDKQKYFIGVCGGKDFGKSVELKKLIYTFAQDEKTDKCLINLVKLSSEKTDYYNDLVEDDFVKDGCNKDAEKLKEFLKYVSSNEADLKNPDYLKQFKDCIEQRFKNHKGQYYELDFVARIVYKTDIEKKEIVICTIGDKIGFIRDNIFNNEVIQKSDLIVCSLRNHNKIKEAVIKDCSKIKEINLLSLKIKVSMSKEIIDQHIVKSSKDGINKRKTHKEIKSAEIDISADDFVKEFYKKIKDGFKNLTDWLKKIHKE